MIQSVLGNLHGKSPCGKILNHASVLLHCCTKHSTLNSWVMQAFKPLGIYKLKRKAMRLILSISTPASHIHSKQLRGSLSMLFQETTYLVNVLLNTSSWMKWALLLHFMNSSNGLRPSPIFHIFHNHGTPSNHILCWTSYWTLSKYPLCSYVWHTCQWGLLPRNILTNAWNNCS